MGKRNARVTCIFCLFLFVVFEVEGSLTPNGTVSLDCGSQQTFTCSVTGPAAVWNITGLSNITAVDISGLSAANNNARITTTDISGLTQTSTITITGFTTADNGGTVQCINLLNVLVEGMATMSVGVPDCPRDINVVEGDLCDSVDVSWTSSPSQTSATVSYCQVSSQGSCMSVVCSISPCTIQGVRRDREYKYTILPTSNCGSPSGCTRNTVTFALAKCNVCTTSAASIIPTALAAVVPSVVLILVNIISVVVVFFLTRHFYKNTSKMSSLVKCAYHQVQRGTTYAHEDLYIKMTDNPAYRPIK